MTNIQVIGQGDPLAVSGADNGPGVRPARAEDVKAVAEASADISHAAALVQLHAFIGDRGFKSGDKLPPERLLATELGLSRSELRKALDILEAEGAVWRHVGKGTFLSTQSNQFSQNDLSVLAKRISPADMMRTRSALEPALVREAALHASDAALGRLQVITERSREAVTWREYETLDNEFHRLIAEATGSVGLLALFDQVNTLRRTIAWARLKRVGVGPPPDYISFFEHERIAECLSARDPEASQAAMRTHLRSVEDRLFQRA